MDKPDLNHLSATAIMGYTASWDYRDQKGTRIFWNPLADMNQVMMVAAKMAKDGWGWSIEHTTIYCELKVELYKDDDPDTVEEMQRNADHYVCESYSDISDLNRAFLTAALNAKGVLEAK